MINNLFIKEYVLKSSAEVDETVEHICNIKYKNLLIHVCSFIHNTVLVQKLKQELKKKIPHVKVVLLKHDDKFKSCVQIYGYDSDVTKSDLESNILNFLYKEKIEFKKHLKESKIDVLKRYFTDHLTNLPNQYQLRKDMQDKEQVTLVNIVIDDFATINNFYGFMVGDFIIEEFGKYLKENLNNNIYRISGTEFSLLIFEKLEFYDLKVFLLNIYKKINGIKIKYQDIDVQTSVTLASCVSATNTNMFSKVSMALKYAKESKLPFWVYEDRMKFENMYEQNLEISNKVRYAVKQHKIIPYFQPILNNKTGKIEKYECLARLLDRNNNIISPVLFIPISKKIKVYNQITKIIIDKSFAAFEDNEFEFSINLSIDDVMSSEIFNFILDKLKNSPASNRVIFEMLESEAIFDFEKMKKFIKEIKRFGAKIAIDDFGSGYSNFSYLTKINVDFIKIDGALIKNIDVDNNSYLVVETIVDFANKLGIEIVAEFVHSSTVMDKVKEMGIHYSQGFYIDKPLIKLPK